MRFKMGLGWIPQFKLMNMWKCINQKKKVIITIGAKLGHGLKLVHSFYVHMAQTWEKTSPPLVV
jgi:hypothetical protein